MVSERVARSRPWLGGSFLNWADGVGIGSLNVESGSLYFVITSVVFPWLRTAITTFRGNVNCKSLGLVYEGGFIRSYFLSLANEARRRRPALNLYVHASARASQWRRVAPPVPRSTSQQLE